MWPRWYPQTSLEMQQDAATLVQLSSAGLLSRETAVASIANLYGVADVAAELARIAAEGQGRLASSSQGSARFVAAEPRQPAADEHA
jgi:hypothetical protein